MECSLEKSLEILARTPAVLRQLLAGLSDEWILTNEGPATWSVVEVLGHLIHGDRTDWLARAEIILSASPDKNFPPFDRFAHLHTGPAPALAQLLDAFEALRAANIRRLRALNITESNLSQTGLHPVFGPVTLAQLLATWAVHDLDHLAQIARVMARQYEEQVGPWKQYLKIIRD